ncbi:hypothetical protein GYMLUDRAFT_870202 [Collybiopsis luxurians FD-317 M1]|nr:hypothetical protein GYMLUDRAFT_870202 [Collybiopsis luxurians FD-317 M1]
MLFSSTWKTYGGTNLLDYVPSAREKKNRQVHTYLFPAGGDLCREANERERDRAIEDFMMVESRERRK